jgi:hypothetical protein
MNQEKWDKFHNELDDAIDSAFGKAKVALREYLLENKEKVAADLDEMREKSNNMKETHKETNMDKFLKLVSDETSTWIEDLEHYNQNKEELDTKFEIELNDLITAQETLEEAAKRTYQKGLQDDMDLSFYDGVRLGAKWQQERMYSEVFEWLSSKDYLSDKMEFIQKEFEQFKKKD